MDGIHRHTNDYGIKIVGFNNVLFISPHSADGFESGVNELVARICVATGSSAIINTQILRTEADLNRHDLVILNSENIAVLRYHSDLHQMIADVRSKFRNIIVVFMHFSPRKFVKRRCLYERMKDGKLLMKLAGDERDYDIDVGCGLTMQERNSSRIYFPSKEVIPSRGRGRPTLDVLRLVNMQNSLNKDNDFRITVGREWAAANKNNMVQWMSDFYKIDVVQLEIVEDISQREELFQALCLMVENFNKQKT